MSSLVNVFVAVGKYSFFTFRGKCEGFVHMKSMKYLKLWSRKKLLVKYVCNLCNILQSIVIFITFYALFKYL